jgi:hypothetical protein
MLDIMLSVFCSDRRCAVLLEEFDNYKGLRQSSSMGHIVVEMRTSNATPLLPFSCSRRVFALPTGQLNARRVRGLSLLV